MTTYYHSCIVCPSCLSPYVSPSLSDAEAVPEVIDEKWFVCKNPKCRAKFNQSPLHIDGIGDIPLYRKVDLNYIESEYISWLSAAIPKGNHLITWCWRDVRFLPIAITEILMKHPDKKIMVLESNKELPKEFRIRYLIDNLYYLSGDSSSAINCSKIDKKVLKDLVLKKRDIINVKYKSFGLTFGSKTTLPEDNFEDYSITKAKNRALKRIEKEFGENSVRKIIIKSGSSEKEDSKNEIDGKWIITLTAEKRWMCKDISYNLKWIDEIAANKDNIKPVRDIIKVHEICDDDSEIYDDYSNLCVLKPSEELWKNPDKIFSMVEDYGPDLLLIPNADDFIYDLRYYGYYGTAYALKKYIDSTRIPSVLFSTDSEMRQYYKLSNKDRKFFDNPDLAIHSVDSAEVLHALSKNDSNAFPSPFSSGNLINSDSHHQNIIYETVENTLGETWNKILDEPQKYNSLIKFIKKLLASPLNAEDFRYDSYTIRTFCNRIYSYGIEGFYPQDIVDGLLNELDEFQIRTNNPVWDKFYEIALKHLSLKPCSENSKLYVIFVVNYDDKTHFVNKMNSFCSDKDFPLARVRVSSWAKLPDLLRNEPFTEDMLRNTLIISSCYPSQKYRLSKYIVGGIVFVSTSENIQKIKKIIELRLVDRITRPLIKPDNSSQLPEFMEHIISSQHEDDNTEELLKDLYSDDEDELVFIHNSYHRDLTVNRKDESDNLNMETESETTRRTVLESGKVVVLALNRNREGIFIPLDTSVMIVKDDLFDDVRIEAKISPNDLSKKLTGKEIIISRSELYSSFRSTFFKYMIGQQGWIKFKIDDREYNFKELYNLSTMWIRFIQDAIEGYRMKYHLTVNKATDDIVNKLSVAIPKEEITVRLWLKGGVEIPYDSESYFLYRTERPSNPNDIRNMYYELEEYAPDFQIDELLLSYKAVLELQKIRTRVLKSKNGKNEESIDRIHNGLKNEYMLLRQNAIIFKTEEVRKCTLSKDVDAFKVVSNPAEYTDSY